MTLSCGVKGGARPDEWKHMLSATEAAESQRKDADRGANLLERQQDRQYLGLGKQEKQGQQDTWTAGALTKIPCWAEVAWFTFGCPFRSANMRDTQS